MHPNVNVIVFAESYETARALLFPVRPDDDGFPMDDGDDESRGGVDSVHAACPPDEDVAGGVRNRVGDGGYFNVGFDGRPAFASDEPQDAPLAPDSPPARAGEVGDRARGGVHFVDLGAPTTIANSEEDVAGGVHIQKGDVEAIYQV